MKVTVRPINVYHPCPVCGSEVTIEKERQNGGMDGGYYDWKIFCNNCNLVNVYYPADCFYGREYYETPCSALAAFDNYSMKFNACNLNKGD